MNDNIWQQTLNKLKEKIAPISYNTWFGSIEFIDIKDESLRLVIPTEFYKKHIEMQYKDEILNIINDISNKAINNIIYILKENLNEFLKNETLSTEKNTEDIEILDIPFSKHKSNLNKKYTFDTFIVGESNRFAQAAALAVAENPGNIYNPLFIYGNSGLGKTHLMHAIGNYIEENQRKRVLYITTDEFMNDFTGLSRKNKKDDNNLDYVEHFKSKYRNIDVLIIDDIQFLKGAEKTQQEFFHTFNNLYNDSKQIIVSSDRSPEDLKVLEDRLRTRFAWGLQVDINPPDLNLKIEIIKNKIRGENISLDENIIKYIATNIGNDVRQLEGSINRLVAYSVIMCETNITIDFAQEALKDFVKKPVTDQNNIRKIQKEVANFYKISFEDIKSKKRTPNLTIPRQVGMYLCRKLTDESFERIGLEFGGKNHATVIHACNKIENEMKSNNNLKDAIDNIEKQMT